MIGPARGLLQTLRRDPNNLRTHLAVRHVHLLASRHAKAREHLERALALEPESGEAWNILRARDVLQRLQAHKPDSSIARKALAELDSR